MKTNHWQFDSDNKIVELIPRNQPISNTGFSYYVRGLRRINLNFMPQLTDIYTQILGVFLIV